MSKTGSMYKLNPIDGNGVPWEIQKCYLRSNFGVYNLKYVSKECFMSLYSYIKAAIDIVEGNLYGYYWVLTLFLPW